MSLRCCSAFAVLALLAGPAAADVIVVEPVGGGKGPALLQGALDAAQDGDLILVRADTYGPIANGYHTPDRSINLAGDAFALPIVAPALPAGIENLTVPLQAVLQHAGVTTLGGVTHFVWVDAAF
jgi:hypothetical protein